MSPVVAGIFPCPGIMMSLSENEVTLNRARFLDPSAATGRVVREWETGREREREMETGICAKNGCH